MVSAILSRFVIVLGEWAKYFPNDFRTEIMIKSFELIQDKCLRLDSYFTDNLNNINKYLTTKHKNLSDYEDYLKKLHYETLLKKNNKIDEVKFEFFLNFPPKNIFFYFFLLK